MRKQVIAQLQTKYKSICKKFDATQRIERELEHSYGSKGDKLSIRLKEYQKQLTSLESKLADFLIAKKVTEDEWLESGCCSNTCCDLEDYIEYHN